ncbi:MAG: zinc ribbon domain-containing protein, partial [Finegoldia magna]
MHRVYFLHPFLWKDDDNMALTTCPECAGKVSDRAAACPHCGYPIKKAPRKKPKP